MIVAPDAAAMNLASPSIPAMIAGILMVVIREDLFHLVAAGE